MTDDVKLIALTINGDVLLAALEDRPPELTEIRAVLMNEHKDRARSLTEEFGTAGDGNRRTWAATYNRSRS